MKTIIVLLILGAIAYFYKLPGGETFYEKYKVKFSVPQEKLQVEVEKTKQIMKDRDALIKENL